MSVTQTTPDVSSPDEPPMTRTYLLVLLVEVLVITALWAFSRHFG